MGIWPKMKVCSQCETSRKSHTFLMQYNLRRQEGAILYHMFSRLNSMVNKTREREISSQLYNWMHSTTSESERCRGWNQQVCQSVRELVSKVKGQSSALLALLHTTKAPLIWERALLSHPLLCLWRGRGQTESTCVSVYKITEFEFHTFSDTSFLQVEPAWSWDSTQFWCTMENAAIRLVPPG